MLLPPAVVSLSFHIHTTSLSVSLLPLHSLAPVWFPYLQPDLVELAFVCNNGNCKLLRPSLIICIHQFTSALGKCMHISIPFSQASNQLFSALPRGDKDGHEKLPNETLSLLKSQISIVRNFTTLYRYIVSC